MSILITLIVIVVAMAIYGVYNSSKAQKMREETVERREKYVESIGTTARIIVNDGIHLFYKDDEQQFFGISENGKQYSFSGLQSISRYKSGISFMHKDSISLYIGKDYAHQDTTIALDSSSINAIYAEMMPVLRKNLRDELNKYGITPTHEYEHNGEIFGCDIEKKLFYCVYGSIQVYNFSELKRVTIDDLSNNSLCSSNYEVNIYVKHEDISMDQYPEYTLYFDSKDAIYHDILAMFKGIRNRQ